MIITLTQLERQKKYMKTLSRLLKSDSRYQLPPQRKYLKNLLKKVQRTDTLMREVFFNKENFGSAEISLIPRQHAIATQDDMEKILMDDLIALGKEYQERISMKKNRKLKIREFKGLTVKKFSNNNHVMIDIETFGKGQNRLIYQLSAIFFNPLTGQTFEEFNEYIDIQSSLDMGCKIDGSTLMYWLTNENQELSKKQFENLKTKSKHLLTVLLEFSEFLKTRDNETVQIYGNGPTFDISALIDAYSLCGLDLPWKYYNERCQRTLEALSPFVRKNIKKKNPELAKNAHDGIVDSKIQILAIHEIINGLNQAFYLGFLHEQIKSSENNIRKLKPIINQEVNPLGLEIDLNEYLQFSLLDRKARLAEMLKEKEKEEIIQLILDNLNEF